MIGHEAARERWIDLVESRPREVVALANLVLERATLSEALARGFDPTDDELAEYQVLLAGC